MEVGRIVEVGFEGQRLPLAPPSAENPLQGNVPWQQFYGDPGIFKLVSGKTEMCLQAAGTQPSRLYQAAAGCARSLHPLQNQGSASTIIAGKQQIPNCNQGGRN